ncbi:MAG: hypothetical protein FJX76_07475 [Armatimonadetes bacterium]|nr:hypothetical protein [Armatimonadota bacterium]
MRSFLIVILLAAIQIGLIGTATAQVNESPYIKWYKWDDDGNTTHVYGEVKNPGTFDVTSLVLTFIGTDNRGNQIAQQRQRLEGPILAGSTVSFDFNVPDTGEIHQCILYVSVGSQ